MKRLSLLLAFLSLPLVLRADPAPGVTNGVTNTVTVVPPGGTISVNVTTPPPVLALPPLFSDHAVLQKAAKVPIWGTAPAGQPVTVTIAGASAEAVADASGKWRAVLDLSAKGPGPYDLTVQATKSGTPLVVHDVVIGEVWVASGQSNMEFVLKNVTGGAAEVAASANPQFRQFHSLYKTSDIPLASLEGKWEVAGPGTAGGFTAVGYYFGRQLQKELGTPVGLIHTSWGGTPSEAWTRPEALATVPDLKEGALKSNEALDSFPARRAAYAEAFHAWEQKYRRETGRTNTMEAYAYPQPGDAAWKTATFPGTFAAAGLPEAGVYWLFRKVTLTPVDVTARPAFDLGAIPGCDAVYWNGQELGHTDYDGGGVGAARRYWIPGSLKMEAGEGVLSIRIGVPLGGAALPAPLRWGSADLSGTWQVKVEKELPPVSDEAKAAFPAPLAKPPSPQNVASRLWNAMLAPAIPYAIRGAIWYQGESNVGRAFQYRTAFPLMISDWRAQWGEGDFPFYFCQLANFQAMRPTPGDSAWAELREAQAKTLSLPNTGMAVLIDCGDEADIHPRDKKTPGERLAAVALAQTYGKAVPFSGPVYQSMVVEGDAIRVRFTHVGAVDGALVARPVPADYAPKSVEPAVRKPLVRNVPGSQLEGFALCGEDRKWFWADAKIDGEAVVVRSKDVPKPVAVRYDWADNPLGNLYNGAGFPAVSFRSDDFPATTEKGRYGF